MATPAICSVDACDKPVRSSGYCHAHYLRWLRHGDPLGGRHRRPSSPDGLCTIEGCNKPTHRGPLCSMHSERIRKHGDPNKGVFKSKGTCTLDGCDRTHYGQGFCLKHYKRWSKYGDPLGGSTEWGAAQNFIKHVAESASADCIIYPFYRNQNGYGWMRLPGRKNIGAHVYAATLAHGEKPTPKPEACHSCNKGHEGCVNPRHIYWGTRSDNLKDAWNERRRKARAITPENT